MNQKCYEKIPNQIQKVINTNNNSTYEGNDQTPPVSTNNKQLINTID